MDTCSSNWGRDNCSNGSTTANRSSKRIIEHGTSGRWATSCGLRRIEDAREKGVNVQLIRKNQTAILLSSSLPGSHACYGLCRRHRSPLMLLTTAEAMSSTTPGARSYSKRVVHPLRRTLSRFRLSWSTVETKTEDARC